MEIAEQFYLCGDCRKWQPFMGNDVTCDCGYNNEFTDVELEEAVERDTDDEEDY